MSDSEPQGLGGWLVLVAIGLIISPIRALLALFRDLLPIFTEGNWPLLTDPSSSAYHPLWAPLLVFDGVSYIAIIAASIIALVLFLQRAPLFPRVMIALYLASLAIVATDFFAARLIPAVTTQEQAEGTRQLLRAIGTCAVWVPYMLRSRRVRNTFIARGAAPGTEPPPRRPPPANTGSA